MKKIVLIIFAALVLGLLPIAMGHTESDPYPTFFTAGGGNPNAPKLHVGKIYIWNDTENLYLMYETKGDWLMTEANLHVATSLDDIPQTNKHNPIPGHFDYRRTYFPGVNLDIFPVPLKWTVGTRLYIAAHAVVQLVDDGVVLQEETAWGGCWNNRFPGKKWAYYIRYTVQ